MKESRENVLVLTYWSFKDALIQTYTLPYVYMIRESIKSEGKIYLVTLEQPHLKVSKKEKVEIENKLRENGIEWISFSYLPFGLMSIFKSAFMVISLWWKIGQKNINTIHSWCTPAGGLGWILSKMTGKKLILDSYEPHAEPMVEAGQWDENSLAFRVLWWLEKKQSQHADVAIGCVAKMKEYAKVKYNSSFESFFVKPAGVDFTLFHPKRKKNQDLINKYSLEEKVVYVYAGKFGGSYLDSETFLILKAAQEFYGDRFAAILLNNHPKEFVLERARSVGLSEECLIQEFVPHNLVPDYMGLGDVGLVPFVPVPSKRYGSPIKTAEYLSMGIPILITKDISDDSLFVLENKLGLVINDLAYHSITNAVAEMDELINNDSELSSRCRISVKEYRSFERAKEIYQHIYSNP